MPIPKNHLQLQKSASAPIARTGLKKSSQEHKRSPETPESASSRSHLGILYSKGTQSDRILWRNLEKKETDKKTSFEGKAKK